MQALGQSVVLAVVGDVGSVAAVQDFHLRLFVESLEVALALLLAFLFDEGHRCLEGDGHGVFAFGQRHELLVVHDVRTEAAVADDHRTALKLAHGAGQLEQLEGLVERQRLHALVGGQLGELRLLLVLGSTNLYHRTEAADLHKHGLARLGVLAQQALAGLMLAALVHGLLDGGLELLVEVLHHLLPLFVALGNLVELLLHAGGEVVVHDVLEVLHQEVVHHDTDVGRQQLALVRAGYLFLLLHINLDAFQRGHLIGAGLALLVALLHVFALLDGRDGRSIGRRTADAQLLQLVHQAGLGIAQRTLAEALGGCNLAAHQLLALAHRGQHM